MLWFKRCPRCQGDLYKDRDMYGEFVACLQCGYYLTDAEMGMLLSRGKREAEHTVQPERESAMVA